MSYKFTVKFEGSSGTRKSTFMKLIYTLHNSKAPGHSFTYRRLSEHEWEITWKEEDDEESSDN